jgi:glucose-1-phosphate cytidylyltransferase
LDDEKSIWEKEPLETLALEGNLNLNFHEGFWRPMDSLKDKMDLNELWNNGKADWKIW